MKNGRAGTDMRAGFLFLYEGRKQHVVSVSGAPNGKPNAILVSRLRANKCE